MMSDSGQDACLIEELRVLIVAGDVLARAGLAALLAMEAHIHVVGQAAPDDTLRRDVDIYEADVMLLDLYRIPAADLRHLSWLDTVDPAPVFLLADDSRLPDVLSLTDEALSFGLLLRDTVTDVMARALFTVSGGMTVIDPALVGALLNAGPLMVNQPLPEPLTERELEVLQLLAAGLTNREIAQRLGITDHTVKFHVNAILTRTGTRSRTGAVVRAARAGLISL